MIWFFWFKYFSFRVLLAIRPVNYNVVQRIEILSHGKDYNIVEVEESAEADLSSAEE